MGNCTYRNDKPSKTYMSSVKISIPSLSHIDYKSKTLISFSSESSFSMPLKKKLHIYRDSSISLIDSNTYIIAGGTDSSNSLTSSVYLLSLSEKSLKKLPNLPIPSKYGVFLSASKYFYYVSGICEPKDNEAIKNEEATPLCRLDKSTFQWEIFTCESQFNPSKYLERKIGINESIDRMNVYAPPGVKLKDLYEPGAVLYENKIYLIGGKLCQGEIKAIDKVFGISLEQENFSINEENFSLPICLSSPSCCIRKNIGCVAGGLLGDMSNNSQVFVIDFKIGVVRKVEVKLDRLVDLRYPIFPDKKGVAFMSYPKVMYLRKDKQQVFVFGIPSAKAETLTKIADESYNEQKTQKIKVNLRINFRIQEKIEEIGKENNKFSQLGVGEDSKCPENFESNPFRVEEENANEQPDKNKTSTVRCSCGTAICKNVNTSSLKVCSHCTLSKAKLYPCEKCSQVLCKPCAKGLELYKPLKNPNIMCQKNHYFCKSLKEPPEGLSQECMNCLKPVKIYLECFVCKVYLCNDCENLVNSLTSPIDVKCANSHLFSWKLLQYTIKPALCDVCLNQIKHIGYFFCLECRFSLCLNCVKTRKAGSSNSLTFFNANSYQEKPKRLSDTFFKTEFNYGDEPEISSYLEPKNKISSVNKILKTEPVFVFTSPIKAKFETNINDYKKLVVPKPLRSPCPPLLQLTPRNMTVDYSRSSFTPRIIELQQKSLASSSESIDQDSSDTEESKSAKSCKTESKDSEKKSRKSGTKELNSFIPKDPAPTTLNPFDLNASYQTKSKKISSSISSENIEMPKSPEYVKSSLVNSESLPKKPESYYSSSDSSEGLSENIKSAKLTPTNRTSYILNYRDSNNSSVYDEESSEFVAPDIRGTLATSKLSALKVKLDLLTAREMYSSTSSEESFNGFAFQPGKDSSESEISKNSEKNSFSKRVSKRYTIESRSFSKESEKKEESIIEESFSSGFADHQIHLE